LYTVTEGLLAASAGNPIRPISPTARKLLREMQPLIDARIHDLCRAGAATCGSGTDLIFDLGSGRIGAISDRGEHP